MAYQNFLDRMSPYTRMILVSAPNVQLKYDGAKEMRKRIWLNVSINKIHLPLKVSHVNPYNITLRCTHTGGGRLLPPKRVRRIHKNA